MIIFCFFCICAYLHDVDNSEHHRKSNKGVCDWVWECLYLPLGLLDTGSMHMLLSQVTMLQHVRGSLTQCDTNTCFSFDLSETLLNYDRKFTSTNVYTDNYNHNDSL